MDKQRQAYNTYDMNSNNSKKLCDDAKSPSYLWDTYKSCKRKALQNQDDMFTFSNRDVSAYDSEKYYAFAKRSRTLTQSPATPFGQQLHCYETMTPCFNNNNKK